MAYRLDSFRYASDEWNEPSFQDTSDAWNDPFCDPCYEADGVNVVAVEYCDDCVQFHCNKCCKFHRKLQATRGHVVRRGADMPKSQADKPPKFSYCEEHSKYLKNQFCSFHKQLICSLCSPLYHKNCSTGSVEDVSKAITSSETNDLYDIVSDIRVDLDSSLKEVVTNIDALKDQKTVMLKQAQKLYDEMMSRAKKLFDDQSSVIDTHYQLQLLVLNQTESRIKGAISRIESSLREIDNLRGKQVDTKLFLRIQNTLSDINQHKDDLNMSIRGIQLSFVPTEEIQDFISSSFTLGLVKQEHLKNEVSVPEILFPIATFQTLPENTGKTLPSRTGERQSAGQSLTLTKSKGRKLGRYNVKLPHDALNCYITGMAITNDDRRLLIDHDNKKVKLFSHDMKLLSSLSLPYEPWNSAVLSDREAVVTTLDNSLIALNISGRHMSIKSTKPLSYSVWGISKYREKLVVTSLIPRPASVKLIDKTGRVYWSVATNDQGKSLFETPLYVTSDIERSTVTVTDRGNEYLTVLNGDTGAIINRWQVNDKSPQGVTTGPSGYTYVCYHGSREVAVLTGDLIEKRTLLSQQDGLSERPLAIVFDKSKGQLITSYWSRSVSNSVDVWDKS